MKKYPSQEAWRKLHPDRVREYRKHWRDTHKAEAAKLSREWKAKNPDKVRATRKKWRMAHPDVYKERRKQWLHKHRKVGVVMGVFESLDEMLKGLTERRIKVIEQQGALALELAKIDEEKHRIDVARAAIKGDPLPKMGRKSAHFIDEAKALEIKKDLARGKLIMHDIAIKHGVSYQTVNLINSGKTWKNVVVPAGSINGD